MPKEMPVPWAEGILAGCSLPVPPPWRRHHIPQELSARVVPSTVTGAGPATIRCLAFVQRTALVKIKGLFHYSGSPSNYAPVISCGSLQAIQAALGWADVALSPGEPWWQQPCPWGGPDPRWPLNGHSVGGGTLGPQHWGLGLALGCYTRGCPAGPPQPSAICTGTSGTVQARGMRGSPHLPILFGGCERPDRRWHLQVPPGNCQIKEQRH